MNPPTPPTDPFQSVDARVDAGQSDELGAGVAEPFELGESGELGASKLDELANRYVDVTHDSRRAGPGVLFACVVGAVHDGHDFAASAVAAGSTGLVVQRPMSASELGVDHQRFDEIEQIVVTDVRATMGFVAAAVHRYPSEQLTVVGITGTNGKTTTTHILADLLSALGAPTEQIGTLSGARTTPEATDLQRQLADFVNRGIDAVVMEVSSHALELHRVVGTRFSLALFTNLGHDHYDLHGGQEAYFDAKASLFRPELTDRGLANADDEFGVRLASSASIPMQTYSVADLGDVQIEIDRISFVWRGHRAQLMFGGEFNLSNALAALESAYQLGYDPAEIAPKLENARPVPGRFEPIRVGRTDAPTVIVDYAHTPDGLESLLSTARALVNDARLIVVFGCGGDRDVDKRPKMGAVAAAGADVVVLTSDNPRNEDPIAIIDDIRSGIGAGVDAVGAEVVVEADRRCAIEASLSLAAPTDIVLIAGKGHEQTQTIGDQSIPFSDREVATAALEKTR